ncbi:uncharacterized protein LOC111828978 [Capsella rubella]|uniref:uncharacterized protein LOC111828978 n=1 Tax=Capsella rubella TaxID=81985 RepID=UPI000CD564DB|nr:uncharacterized protein LOC111828978 [Capsella rubella]
MCRIFKIKLDALMKDLTEDHLLGKTIAAMYTIEFQKRGLPHAHILLFIDPSCKLPTGDDIDKIISAEIPDKEKTLSSTILLSLRYRAHINVEWCNQTGSIKYINKGHDRVAFVIEPKQKNTDSGNGSEPVANIRSDLVTAETTDSGDGEIKKIDEIKDYFDCRYVSASEAAWRLFKFPIQYRSIPVMKLLFHLPRKQPVYFKEKEKIKDVLERMEDEYYMRILLGIVTGPQSDDDIRTYKVVVYDTYKKACWARGILEDDQAYIDSLIEATLWFFGDQLHLTLTDEEKKNYTLEEIEEVLLRNGGSFKYFKKIPKPTNIGVDLFNRLITEERNYLRDALREKHDEWIGMMTDEQRAIYDEIITVVLKDCGGVFFVYGFGSTRKTFLWKTLSAALRYRGLIAINVASSGIASLLLDGGRTAHSRFAIPINPDDFTMCNISPDSDLANMLEETSLIIWDEPSMMSRYSFENLDRGLSDIMRNTDNKPFGGKVVVFGGDFRQVLPVINGAGRAQIVLAALNSSYLWEHIKFLTITKNMRLMSKDLSESAARDIKVFSDWILAVGEGKVAEPNDGDALINIPEEFFIKKNSNDPIEATAEQFMVI